MTLEQQPDSSRTHLGLADYNSTMQNMIGLSGGGRHGMMDSMDTVDTGYTAETQEAEDTVVIHPTHAPNYIPSNEESGAGTMVVNNPYADKIGIHGPDKSGQLGQLDINFAGKLDVNVIQDINRLDLMNVDSVQL